VKRLLLVRHGATSATRAAAFPADEPIEEGAAALAAGLAGLARTGGIDAGASGAGQVVCRRADDVLASPALRCAQTAAAAGLSPQAEPRIAECDFGAWAGRALADLHAADPEAVGAWMTDPDAAPHGGESLRAFAERVGGWLDEQAAANGKTLAITHGGVVKACVVRALGAPLDAFWRIDVAPLSVTELHAHDGRWTVTRMNGSLSDVRASGRSDAAARDADAPPAAASGDGMGGGGVGAGGPLAGRAFGSGAGAGS
jgi:broad specificity phosphatase PhoE